MLNVRAPLLDPLLSLEIPVKPDVVYFRDPKRPTDPPLPSALVFHEGRERLSALHHTLGPVLS